MTAAVGFAALVAGRSVPGSAAAAITAAGIAGAALSEGWIDMKRIRNPFVAAARATAPPAAASQGVCPLGFGPGQDPKYLYKTYPPVELPTVLSTLGPRHVTWVYFKNQALVAVLTFNAYLYEVLEAEEAALEGGVTAEQPPFPEIQPMLERALHSSARELLTTLTRRVYEHWWRAKASARWAWKVLKNWRESVTRKAMWYAEAPSASLWPLYARTVARCTALMYAADFTVSTIYSAHQIMSKEPGGPGRAAQWDRLLARLPALARQHFLRCALTWGIAAAGAAAVAAAAPRARAGAWAGIGHLVFDVAVSNGVVYFLIEGHGSAGAKDAAAGQGGSGGGQSGTPSSGGGGGRGRQPPAPALGLGGGLGGSAGGGGGDGGDGAGDSWDPSMD